MTCDKRNFSQMCGKWKKISKKALLLPFCGTSKSLVHYLKTLDLCNFQLENKNYTYFETRNYNSKTVVPQ